MTHKRVNLSRHKAGWPSNMVARKDVDKFTGGAIKPGTMANLDSQGLGPEDRFMIGRNVCYWVDSLIACLESRAVALD